MAENLRITLKRSRIGRSEKQQKVLQGLGLMRLHQEVLRKDTKSLRGMIKKIDFMVDVEECE